MSSTFSKKIKLNKNGNYSAPTGRIIIAWGNAPGAGVHDVIALKGRSHVGWATLLLTIDVVIFC